MTDFPIQGRPYTTKTGDTLKTISAAAYGTEERWRDLLRAFSKKYRTTEDYQVFPGEVINIPEDTTLARLKREQRG